MKKSTTEKIWTYICKHRHIIALIGILLLAALFRFSGVNWDNFHNFHPDERALGFAGMKIDFLKMKIDPELYAYGTLPIYLAKIGHMLAAHINSMWDGFDHYLVAGRLLSATFGILTIFFVYLTGKKLYDIKVGLLSSLFLTLTVLHIQNCHFFTVDITLSFFVTATIYYLIDIYYSKATIKNYIIVSVLIGMALAVKASAAPLAIIFFICHFISLIQNKEALKIKPYLFFFLCGLTAILVNFICQPIAYLKMGAYIHEVQNQINLIKNASVCYTQQYIGSQYIIYYFKQMIYYCMGAPLAILCIISFIIAIINAIRHPIKTKHAVLLLWAVPYFLTINSFEAKFLRYLLPLFPFLCLFAGYYFLELLGYLKTSPTKKLIGRIVTIILIGYTLFYALAFSSIYMKHHTFVTASKWFHLNVPEHSFVLSQHWDEGFPLNLKTGKNNSYEIEKLALYDAIDRPIEGEKKAEYLAEQLDQGEYIVAQTKRLYGATRNVKERYPITTKYFDLLFSGRLGYKLVKSFTSYPSLLGIEIDDDLADESFSVYDHPKVLIFQKVKALKKEEIQQLLEEKTPLTLTTKELLSLKNSKQKPITKYTIIDEVVIILFWIILLELFGVIGFAICYKTLKKSLPSSLFFTNLLGILSFSYIIWILSSVNLIKYNAITIIIIFLSLFFISSFYLYTKKVWLKQWIKENIDTILFSKIVLFTCFIIFLILRSSSPEIFWGEKPMDFAIFNNLLRIDSLPPDEIWFSGEKLNYYYFGYFIYATLSKMSFIPSFFTYNLSLATIAGFGFSAACGIMFLLNKKYIYALVAGITTIFLGNLSGIRELIYGPNPINFHFFWATSRVIPHTVNEYPLWSLLFGDLHGHLTVMPIFLLLIYLGINFFNRTISKDNTNWGLVITTSLTLGIIAVTNSWDFPGASAILFICLLASLYCLIKGQRSNFSSLLSTSRKPISVFIITVLTSFIWFLPYWLYTKRPSVDIGFLSQEEFIQINDFFFVWGLYLFIFLVFFLTVIFTTTKEKSTTKNALALTIGLAGLILASTFYSTHFLTIIFILLGITTLLFLKKDTIKLICILVIYGLCLTLFTETIFIYDRMNTIFKFFLECWYLFSLCSVYIVYYLLKEHFIPLIKGKNITAKVISYTIILLGIGLASLCLFTSITAIIGFSKTDHLGTYKPTNTINGFKYIKYKTPSEQSAINWINENIKEQDASMIEATGKPYGRYSRIVMNTGIPTLVGWIQAAHLKQRAIKEEDINKRAEAVETIYTTDDASKASDILKSYNIKYVYIGPIETDKYGIKGLKKFKETKELFKLLYSDKEVAIFEVL